MNYYEQNIELLARRPEQDLDIIALPTDADRRLTYLGIDEGVKVFVDDADKPLIVDQQIDSNNLPTSQLKQLIFMFGIASLQEIEIVAQTTHPDSVFIIIEPLPTLFVHALNDDDFSRLNNIKRYILITAASSEIESTLNIIFSGPLLMLARRPVFYFNSYYRRYDRELVIPYIKVIREFLVYKFSCIGNSAADSLVGLINNLKNLEPLSQSLDVAKLKNRFTGCPAFVVSAGPSLDKNIEQLKRIGDRGLILAVDTIAAKLIKSGIIPHFICSVERVVEVWKYFYEQHTYPDDVYLAVPPLVDHRIVEKFAGRAVLPMRINVREYRWLAQLLGFDSEHFVWMGASCAHMAMGLAVHLGASVVTLVGQDLAFDQDKSHASDTISQNQVAINERKTMYVPGYYGGEVLTNEIWLLFKQLFESYILEINTHVIDATEGGAKIDGTTQMPLAAVIDKYCIQKHDIRESLREHPNNNLQISVIRERLQDYCQRLDEWRMRVATQLSRLEQHYADWDDEMSEQQAVAVYRTLKLTNDFYHECFNDELLQHNIQANIQVIMQRFHLIPEDESLMSLKQNLVVQIELCKLLENTAWIICRLIEENGLQLNA